MSEKNDFATTLIHTGTGQFAKKPELAASVAEALPIYLTSVFTFDDVPSHGAITGAGGYHYTRCGNPNADAVSEILAAADGGEQALVFSSGMAAITSSILAFVQSGDHIIASKVLYGAVYDFLAHELLRFGVEVSFVDFLKEDARSYIRPTTRLLYTEMISNPLMEVPDIRALAGVAHAHGLKLFVDNTFASPVVVKPLSLGADAVLYSATKYLGGHNDITAGAVIADAAVTSKIQRIQQLYGGILGPSDCWLLARSLRTLDLRVRKHAQNALVIAEFLESQPGVARVYYPGLSSSPSHERARRQFENGLFGGMLSVDLTGGETAAVALIKALQTILFAPSLAGTATTVSYAVKTSHRYYAQKDLDELGITAGQLRFSVGLEEPEDILRELETALAQV
ncbi:MAG: aminotransferase class I/II-fold pyridoxal phosphate-dependent enzyme [Clostridiales Family XIII bacterium]|jgi:methionine-gamma-lyase|nr:aminotransferase class I/II-fold pyridoxal phosphate-dependent enzyme [Clostridiales Family XIII bacterium]